MGSFEQTGDVRAPPFDSPNLSTQQIINRLDDTSNVTSDEVLSESVTDAEEPETLEGPGLVEVYTGNGRGKSTAAFGLALRALGRGLRVACIQFMRGTDDMGELIMLDHVPSFRYYPMKADSKRQSDIEVTYNTFFMAQRIAYSGCYDVVIMDEINLAMGCMLLSPGIVLEMLRCRPPGVEMVLTGRCCPEEITEYADLVTDMRLVRHPYDRGIKARKGLDYRFRKEYWLPPSALSFFSE